MKTKVIHVQSRICIGGPALYTEILSKHMPANNYQSMLIGGELEPDEYSKFKDFKNKGIDIRIISTMRRDIRLLKDIQSICRLYQIFRKEKPDIVHTHTAKAGAIGRIAAKLANVPVIIHTFHGHAFKGYFSSWMTRVFIYIEKLLARITDLIIAISPSQKHDLCYQYKIVSEKKVVIIPYGFDLDKFTRLKRTNSLKKELGLNSKAVLAAVIGRLVPIKNYSMAIRVIQRLNAQNNPIYLLIVGDGEEKEKLQKLAKEKKIDQYVYFYGWEEDIIKIYAGIDLMLLTSNNEGTPVTIIEAMASRIPVFATRAGGVVDMINHHENGFLCNLGNVDEMVDHVTFYLQNIKKYSNLVEQAFSYSIKTFSYQRMINDMDLIYQTLLNTRGKASVRS